MRDKSHPEVKSYQGAKDPTPKKIMGGRLGGHGMYREKKLTFTFGLVYLEGCDLKVDPLNNNNTSYSFYDLSASPQVKRREYD